jgi:hypothetical protein
MKPMIVTLASGREVDCSPLIAGLVTDLMEKCAISRSYAIKMVAETTHFSEWQVKQAINETKGEKV